MWWIEAGGLEPSDYGKGKPVKPDPVLPTTNINPITYGDEVVYYERGRYGDHGIVQEVHHNSNTATVGVQTEQGAEGNVELPLDKLLVINKQNDQVALEEEDMWREKHYTLAWWKQADPLMEERSVKKERGALPFSEDDWGAIKGKDPGRPETSTGTFRVTHQFLEESGLTPDVMAENILQIYALSSQQDYDEGVGWYDRIGDKSDEWSQTLPFSKEQIAAVHAVLSPQLNWEQNEAVAEQIIHGVADGTITSPEQVESMSTHVYNADMTPLKAQGYARDRVKAFNILTQGDLSNLGDGRKVNTFYRNFMGTNEDITADVWATRIAIGDPNLNPQPADDIAYSAIEEAYRLAAQEVGITPRELQAVVWVAYRRMGGQMPSNDAGEQMELFAHLKIADPQLDQQMTQWWAGEYDKTKKDWRSSLYEVIMDAGGLQTRDDLRPEYNRIPNTYKRRDGMTGDEMAEHLATHHPEFGITDENSLIQELQQMQQIYAELAEDEFNEMWGEGEPQQFQVGDTVKVKELLHYLPENQSKYPTSEGKIQSMKEWPEGDTTYNVVFGDNLLPAIFSADELEYVDTESDPLEDMWKNSWWKKARHDFMPGDFIGFQWDAFEDPDEDILELIRGQVTNVDGDAITVKIPDIKGADMRPEDAEYSETVYAPAQMYLVPDEELNPSDPFNVIPIRDVLMGDEKIDEVWDRSVDNYYQTQEQQPEIDELDDLWKQSWWMAGSISSVEEAIHNTVETIGFLDHLDGMEGAKENFQSALTDLEGISTLND